MRRLALTSWSLHRSLSSQALSLLELPAEVKKAGIDTIEICHFHLPTTDASYLAELRSAIENAGVELFSVLIDAGDISSEDMERRANDIRMIEEWMGIAAHLGAEGVRIVAGESPADDTAAIERSIEALRHFASYGHALGVRVRTENFRTLSSTAENCNHMLDALDGTVGLCADIGNFAPPSRVAEFTDVVGRAEVVHCKASYDNEKRIVPDDMRACLEASVAAGFEGPYTLVYDSGPDEWAGINGVREVVEPFTR